MSSALSLKKCARLPFLLEICRLLFFLLRKVGKMILNLLNNSEENVNKAFFKKKNKCKTCFNAEKSLTLISYMASCIWPDERAPESRCKVSIRSSKKRLHAKKKFTQKFLAWITTVTHILWERCSTHIRHLITEFSSERIYPVRQKSSYLTFRLNHILSYASIAGSVTPKEPWTNL